MVLNFSNLFPNLFGAGGGGAVGGRLISIGGGATQTAYSPTYAPNLSRQITTSRQTTYAPTSTRTLSYSPQSVYSPTISYYSSGVTGASIGATMNPAVSAASSPTISPAVAQYPIASQPVSPSVSQSAPTTDNTMMMIIVVAAVAAIFLLKK